MAKSQKRPDAGVIDVLYAVALGEGFFAAMYEIKEGLTAGQFLLLGTGGQSLYRLILGFFIIIVSWLYYRQFMINRRDYPTSEFAIDIIVMIAYMALLLFVDWPTGYYSVIAFIWLFYLMARIASGNMNAAYLIFGLAFVVYFIVAAGSAFVEKDLTAEWLRLALVTIGVAVYRFLDLRMRRRLRFE